MNTVAETVALAIQVTEGHPEGVRKYELRSRLLGHTVPQLRDALTVGQRTAARNMTGRSLTKADLIAVIVADAMANPPVTDSLKSALQPRVTKMSGANSCGPT